jgi:hypothetical protein
MSETETSHEPTPDELARQPTDATPHPADRGEEGHVAAAHVDPDAHDEHAHGGETLGPVDVRAWGALALGVAAGLLVVHCLVITTTLLAPAAG